MNFLKKRLFYLSALILMCNSLVYADIKVGILHSMTGTMSISEKTVVDATLFAIDEINAKGGLLGQKLIPIVADGKSDWPTFAKEAERLIKDEKVSVVFGCWTSASRKTVKPVFEKYNNLLFYPVQFEGLEESKNIIYTGAAPNQQLIPAAKWAVGKLGKKFFLVGSDYVFPRSANAILQGAIKALRGQVVGEEYVPLGSIDVKEMVKKIKETKPNVILNSINGDTNVAFFKELRAAGISAKEIPTISFSIAEEELLSMNTAQMEGDFAAWNYFQSIDSENNKAFVEKFKNKFGKKRVVSDPMDAGYFGVNLWANAVNQAKSHDPVQVREIFRSKEISFMAPEGQVYIDKENGYTWKMVRIGKIRSDGQFDTVWNSGEPVQPVPYPTYRTKDKWNEFLMDLNKKWNGAWAAPK